jgi:hypothetical protein
MLVAIAESTGSCPLVAVALGVAVGLLVDDVHPLIDTRAREPIKAKATHI